VLKSVKVKINKLYFAETVGVYKYLCNVQGAARHWRNQVRTRVIPLDSSDSQRVCGLWVALLSNMFGQ
jgi:hypothetical protein